jgi:hypothetical protein
VGQSATRIDSSLPVWQDFSPYLKQVSGSNIPDCDVLNELLQRGLRSQGGKRIRFVESGQLDDEPYELRIFNSGRVSTRPDNWHDFFNALVWARFPYIKVAMNACHVGAWQDQHAGERGPRRDALTLFDECGVIVFSSRRHILEALAERRWTGAFSDRQFTETVGISVCGHAMLEKYLSPYKSMTAKALLIHVDESFMALPREEKLAIIDKRIARGLLENQLLQTPASLSPLPLAGVPGWWPETEQLQHDFYRDTNVFRPPAADFAAAPIIHI